MAQLDYYHVHRNARKFASVTRAVADTTNVGTEIHKIRGYDLIDAFWINVTAYSGAAASVVVKIQSSPDGGITWLDTVTSSAIVVASGVHVVKVPVVNGLFDQIRVVDVVANTTTPSITYEIWYGFAKPGGSLPTEE